MANSDVNLNFNTGSTTTLGKFEYLVPPEDLVVHYRDKLRQLGADYCVLLEKVQEWQSSTSSNFNARQELQEARYEVSKLQRTVSDLQVYIHKEREQILQLNSENRRLHVKLSEEYDRIKGFLAVKPEREITFFKSISQRGHTHLKRRENVEKRELHQPKTHEHVDDDTAEILRMTCLSMEKELAEVKQLNHNHINLLMKDRLLIRKEWRREQIVYQKQVAELSASLKKCEQELIEATKEIIVLKKDAVNRELTLCSDVHKRPETEEDQPSILGVKFSGTGSSDRNICAQIKTLENELLDKEKLITNYEEKCSELQNELIKYKEHLENKTLHQNSQIRKLLEDATFLKKMCNETERRRKLDVQGFCSDVMILRRRLEKIEKTLSKVCRKEAPQNKKNNVELCCVDMPMLWEMCDQSEQLKQELEKILKRVKELFFVQSKSE